MTTYGATATASRPWGAAIRYIALGWGTGLAKEEGRRMAKVKVLSRLPGAYERTFLPGSREIRKGDKRWVDSGGGGGGGADAEASVS